MLDPHPRYVCLHYEHVRGISSEPQSSYVLDSWYCYEHVAHFEGSVYTYFPSEKVQRYVTPRMKAEALAAEWNAEHDAWLTQVDVTHSTRKDA